MWEAEPPTHIIVMSSIMTMSTESKRVKVPVWCLLFLSASGGAADLGYAIEASYALPVLQGVGIPLKYATILLAISPILGMLLQPFLGSFSDQCRSPCGRRKPFILTFSIMAIIGCLASYMTYLTDVGIDIIYVQVTVVFLIGLFDFSIGQLQLPTQAFLLDIVPLSQCQTANFIYILIIMIYATLGFALGAVPWSKVFGNSFTVEQQAQVVFGLGAVIMFFSLISTLLSFKEAVCSEHHQCNKVEHIEPCEVSRIDCEDRHKSTDTFRGTSGSGLMSTGNKNDSNHTNMSDESSAKHTVDNDIMNSFDVKRQVIRGSKYHNSSLTTRNHCTSCMNYGSLYPSGEPPCNVVTNNSADNLSTSITAEPSTSSLLSTVRHNMGSGSKYKSIESVDRNASRDQNDNKTTESNNDSIIRVQELISSNDKEISSSNDDPVLVTISTHSSIADGPSYKCCKRFSILHILRTSVIDTLSFIYHMSLSMWIVWFVVFFGFFGDFSFVNAFTTFVGTVVYGGDPKAHVDSDQYQLFSKGVRMGSLALTVSSIFGGIFSVTLNFISKWIRVKTILLFCLAFAVVALFLMTVFQEFYFIMIVGLFYGPYLAAMGTIPFIFIPIYEEKGLLFRKAWRNAPDVIEGKACGVLFSAMFSGQILSSFVVGPVVEAAGDGNYLVIIPCVAVTVTFMFAVFIKS